MYERLMHPSFHTTTRPVDFLLFDIYNQRSVLVVTVMGYESSPTRRYAMLCHNEGHLEAAVFELKCIRALIQKSREELFLRRDRRSLGESASISPTLDDPSTICALPRITPIHKNVLLA